ncbi:pyrroline-5-carboxylate reductase [Bacillus pakistanensis]|uniref:Pyrroline-5-carboxylate reductase n=1 Tax=Rossellomorea pakistanensis TaxID=992288 RepID=A0ABS2NEP6_9BACI|nr:pyrroline-5-carboxylate reductase [Bacillus pakistanensis]
MNQKIGFIGCGNMAQAIIGGIIQSGLLPKESIIGSAKSEKSLEQISRDLAIKVTKENILVAKEADILFLSIKPDQYAAVIEEIREHVKKEVIIVTIAAGITMDWIEEQFQFPIKVIRTMPNTPSLVREGMTAFCVNHTIQPEEKAVIASLLESFGKSEEIEERLMDAIPAVSGSSPAYAFMFIEALADGAVKDGISRDKAYQLAAQSLFGAAKMVLETGKHPGELKDQVCSPGGATIEAVATLEKHQFRGAILKAMEECTKKSMDLGRG